MVRRDLVCRLRALASNWEKAIAEKDRGRLRVLLEQLERAVPSLEELKWSGAARVTKVGFDRILGLHK